MPAFSYTTAFSRNIGWVTESEQQTLRHKRIAIGGLGGVGGSYLLALTRLGVENFHISDLDCFDLSNFNRQVGATISTINKEKIAVMAATSKDINPGVNIKAFPQGLTEENYISFLNNVDLFLDSLDLYALPLKMKIFSYCYKNNIPIVTAAPIGMSTSLLIFMPGSMSPENYFGIPESDPIEVQILKFLVGVNPSMRALKNLVQTDGVQLKGRKLPSLTIGIELATSVACTSALKILLGRGPILTAPKSCHFDSFENKHYITWRPFGSRNPLQWFMQRYLAHLFKIKL